MLKNRQFPTSRMPWDGKRIPAWHSIRDSRGSKRCDHCDVTRPGPRGTPAGTVPPFLTMLVSRQGVRNFFFLPVPSSDRIGTKILSLNKEKKRKKNENDKTVKYVQHFEYCHLRFKSFLEARRILFLLHLIENYFKKGNYTVIFTTFELKSTTNKNLKS